MEDVIVVRKLQEADIDRVAEIWLDTNIRTHPFIAASYWRDHFEAVKGLLLQTDVYVYEEQNEIQGFVGVRETYIEGLFVWHEAQSRGIGKELLDFVKRIHKPLHLRVYQKTSGRQRFIKEKTLQFSGRRPTPIREKKSISWYGPPPNECRPIGM